MSAAALLAVREIDTYYGQSHVLQGISIEVSRGTVVALLGRNGAGKTTALKSIMGIVPPRRGRIVFEGDEVQGWPVYRIARRGIAYVPEDRGVFPSLTVAENLSLVGAGGHPRAPWDEAAIDELFPRLRERRGTRAARLSGGEQQMLSIARALLANPRLLILDEPTAGLAPLVVGELARIFRRLKASRMSMLLVEQNYPFATDLSDRLYVIGKGRIRWEGSPRALERTATVKHTWIGV